MAAIDNGDILRIGATMDYGPGTEVTNVYHCLVTQGGGKAFSEIIADVQEYMDMLVEEHDVFLMQAQAADYISVANATQSLVFGSIEWGAFTAGGQSGDPTPSGACVLVYGRTFAPRVQLRKYFGVCGELNCTGGVWTSVLKDAFALDMADHVTEQVLTDGLGLLGVAYNRTLGTHQLVQSLVVAAEPAYQRRRRRGAGS